MDVPVVWFQFGEKFAVVIGDHVFNLENEFSAVYVYFSCFSIFGIEWNCVKQGGVKKKRGFPNRGSLELIHW